MTCRHCGSHLGGRRSFCELCGTIQSVNSAGEVECESHAGEQAVALCVLCGKPVCNDCAVTSNEKIFCDNPQHQEVATHWSTVYDADSEFESDMIARNLLDATFSVQVFSFRKYLGTFWLPDAQLVRVMVPREQHDKAVDLLRSLRLLDQLENT